MKVGAFALIDCLGFKGIWGRHDPRAVIDKLLDIERIIEKEISPIMRGFPSVDSSRIIESAKFLSDTVAISVTFENPDEVDEHFAHHLVFTMCTLLVRINSHFLALEPHLILRGCVTFGKHIFERNFIIGPAVDQAAEYEKLPNGAFIWLEPGAAELYLQSIKQHAVALELCENASNVEEILADVSRPTELRVGLAQARAAGHPPMVVTGYNMPIKNGEKLSCSVLNPLCHLSHPDVRRQVIEAYDNAMSENRLDVIIKRQNTIAFLEQCEITTEDYYHRLVEHLEAVRNVHSKVGESESKSD